MMVDTADLNFPARDSDTKVVLDALAAFPRGARRHMVGGALMGNSDARQPSLV